MLRAIHTPLCISNRVLSANRRVNTASGRFYSLSPLFVATILVQVPQKQRVR